MRTQKGRQEGDETANLSIGGGGPYAIKRTSWLRKHLLAWFWQNRRSFPWRDSDRSPYEILVAEIFLQRTAAAGVARSYPAFIQRYPSWAAIASSPPEDLESTLRPLGLWRQKARALRRLALFFEERVGAFPNSRAALERLPGIGPYTASTILTILCGRAEPFVDVNMVRLLGRYFGLPTGVRGGNARQLWALGLRLVSGGRCLEVNWAVIDFAALVCGARRPLCPQCPLRTQCRYRVLTPSRATPTPSAVSGSRSAGGR